MRRGLTQARSVLPRAEIQEGAALVALPSIELARTDDHVVEPVPVHVAGPGERGSELAVLLVALGDPGGARPESLGGAEEGVYATLARLAMVIAMRADDHVGVPVAI